MHVIVDAVQGEDGGSQTDGFAAQEAVDDGLHLWRQQRFAIFGRPDDVVEELPIGHDDLLA